MVGKDYDDNRSIYLFACVFRWTYGSGLCIPQFVICLLKTGNENVSTQSNLKWSNQVFGPHYYGEYLWTILKNVYRRICERITRKINRMCAKQTYKKRKWKDQISFKQKCFSGWYKIKFLFFNRTGPIIS